MSSEIQRCLKRDGDIGRKVHITKANVLSYLRLTLNLRLEL